MHSRGRKHASSSGKKQFSKLNLSNTMRMLWEQHVYWTRMTIVSMINNLPDVNFVTARLLRNPLDFEEVLRPIYGYDIAREFAELLEAHLVIAAQLIAAAIAGDTMAAKEAEVKWYANADEIATFLARINPYWSKKEWQTMLYEHLALTKSEALAILNRQYEQSIEIFDRIEPQALTMADVMTRGIIKQFPFRFYLK